MHGVTLAMRLGPLVTRIRMKIELEKSAEHKKAPGQDVDDRTLIFNWDASKLEQDHQQADAGTQVDSEVLATDAAGSALASSSRAS